MKSKTKAYVIKQRKDNFKSSEKAGKNNQETLPAPRELITEEEQLQILADIIIAQLLKQL